MSYDVQRATAKDFLSISALDNIAWDSHVDLPDGEHTWRIWCQYSSVYIVRVPEAKGATGDVAAALLMFRDDQDMRILHKIMVHPDYRGKGMGTVLMEAALAHAAWPVMLTVNPANTRAVELYQRFGFEILEHVPGYYRPDEPRYVMIWQPSR